MHEFKEQIDSVIYMICINCFTLNFVVLKSEINSIETIYTQPTVFTCCSSAHPQITLADPSC